jgi:arylsulfatase A-like enzyme
MIVFTSDNGPALLDGYDDDAEKLAKQENYKPGGPMRWGKYGILEAGTRVPMIVSWPKKIKRGTSDALMSQVDFVRSFETFFNQPVANDYAKDSEDN